MCVEKRTFLDLCELYPKTAENLKMRGLERRAVYLKYMKQEDSNANDSLDISGNTTTVTPAVFSSNQSTISKSQNGDDPGFGSDELLEEVKDEEEEMNQAIRKVNDQINKLT